MCIALLYMVKGWKQNCWHTWKKTADWRFPSCKKEQTAQKISLSFLCFEFEIEAGLAGVFFVVAVVVLCSVEIAGEWL